MDTDDNGLQTVDKVRTSLNTVILVRQTIIETEGRTDEREKGEGSC